MDVIVRNMESSSIRVDKASKKGSVIDTVKMVLGCTSSSGNTNLRRLTTRFPDLCVDITRLRINGKGMATPVADAKLLVQVVLLLPGQKAIEFRRKSADVVCRLLGGDMSLVKEIEQRCATLQRSPEGRVIQDILLGDGDADRSVVTSSTSSQIDKYEGMPAGFRFLDASDQHRVAKEVVKQALDCKKQALKRRRCEDMVDQCKSLSDIGVDLDNQTKKDIRDNLSLLTKGDLALEGSQET
ncbi:unknown [Feldmannia species virus]|uniref:Uncharacterized protein n=1 Tax=Feldmannia species virus TaxID=39420 RepID=B5LWF8_9PHYC|nr:hypothetical protein FeldSpV_gp069 [Feldmannia species virus]ACH46821.1 unknown [Feldmannia species virus]